MFAITANSSNGMSVTAVSRLLDTVKLLCVFVTCHTWRAGTTVERTHSIHTLNQWSERAPSIICQTLIHILTAVAVALPT